MLYYLDTSFPYFPNSYIDNRIGIVYNNIYIQSPICFIFHKTGSTINKLYESFALDEVARETGAVFVIPQLAFKHDEVSEQKFKLFASIDRTYCDVIKYLKNKHKSFIGSPYILNIAIRDGIRSVYQSLLNNKITTKGLLFFDPNEDILLFSDYLKDKDILFQSVYSPFYYSESEGSILEFKRQNYITLYSSDKDYNKEEEQVFRSTVISSYDPSYRYKHYLTNFVKNNSLYNPIQE
jgi:hypothetical protein